MQDTKFVRGRQLAPASNAYLVFGFSGLILVRGSSDGAEFTRINIFVMECWTD